MKLTKEQFEDIITVGEAKAVVDNKMQSVWLIYSTPVLDDEVEEGKTYRTHGYVLDFRPKAETGYHNEHTESEISDYYDTKKKEDKEWSSIKRGLVVGFNEFIKDYGGLDKEYLISFDKQKYASWEPFARAFGITELVVFGTKIPRVLAVKLTRICEDEGETPSWRIRLLIQEYLTEQIKERVRQVLFEG